MTEIPMPGDYGAPQSQPAPQSKGCCTRICECWLYLLIAGVLIVFFIFLIFELQIFRFIGGIF
ncbi:MAG: hypothetical protein ACP6KW_10610 [Candidatus Thorarchaeota archaeon]